MPPIHDAEPDTSAPVVATLIAAECPQWDDLALTPVRSTGTSNAMWRLGEHLVVRLPRTRQAAEGLATETCVLPRLRGILPVSVPEIAHVGRPGRNYPHPWAVLRWQPGRDAWSASAQLTGAAEATLARQLADVVRAVQHLDPARAPCLHRRSAGERGGPLPGLDEAMRDWARIGAAAGVLDQRSVMAAWRDLVSRPAYLGPAVVTHGDLIPSNLLVHGTRLSAVLDWGAAALADPAVDLLPAWTLFGMTGRESFRAAVGCDESAWLRGRAFALQQAVAGVAYYLPRGEPAGLFHARTLAAVLAG